MPVSTTSDNTCSVTCPLKSKGCYAKKRFGPLGICGARIVERASPGAYLRVAAWHGTRLHVV